MARRVAKTTQLSRRGRGRSVAPAALPRRLVADLRKMIDESRQAVAQTVNTALVWLYWSIGRRIHADMLQQKRAEYGEQIVSSLSRQLTGSTGGGTAPETSSEWSVLPRCSRMSELCHH